MSQPMQINKCSTAHNRIKDKNHTIPSVNTEKRISNEVQQVFMVKYWEKVGIKDHKQHNK